MATKPDIKADKQAAADDRGETTAQMEPLLLGQQSPKRAPLMELVVELVQCNSAFRHALPDGLISALADLVRAMNCYYSNLIEGHDTHPIDIERALQGDYSGNAKKRNLQLEAKAHIAVQQWIDDGALEDSPVAISSILEIHRRFCDQLPDELLWVEDPETHRRIKVIPGELRRNHVRVGAHVPISPGAVKRFLARYEGVYSNLQRAETILSAAASHHRLLWIHPFLDGNGRVARLVSHAVLLRSLETGAVWSVARGLARQVDRYRQHLMACDAPRRGDLDGRGALSESNLADFTEFFLRTCIDQVAFMQGLMQPDQLRPRVRVWADEEVQAKRLPPKSRELLDVLLYRGEVGRGDVAGIVSSSDRQARRVVASLIDRGVIKSDSARAPLKLALPAALADRWLPGLFPAAPAK